MSRLSIVAVGLILLCGAQASAQEGGRAEGRAPEVTLSSNQVTATPEMWFYEQYRRDQLDPKMIVRRKAEFRAVQRQNRLAARRWFGLSNARPTTSPDPLYGQWTPAWAGNTLGQPFLWTGWGRPWVVVTREKSETIRR